MSEPLPDAAITAEAVAAFIAARPTMAAALRAQGAATERARIRDNSTFVRGLKNGEDAYVVRADLLDGDGDG